MSTLIKKQLVTKSGTVPAKYMLTETGLELAQKLVHVENSTNGNSPDDIGHASAVMAQNSKHTSVPSGVAKRKNNFISQEVVEDLESRLPRPWLLSQENECLTNAPKMSSISSKEKSIPEQEVIISDEQSPLNSEATRSPIMNYKSIHTFLPSDSMLPGNSTMHNSVQSDELRYKHVVVRCFNVWSSCFIRTSDQFWYVDNEGNLVHEKNKAAILFDS